MPQHKIISSIFTDLILGEITEEEKHCPQGLDTLAE